ncbi:MAG: site-specific DNA-methyltransferase [Chloroflexi bacterium]|nr:site-specific DNA-methyltransferase [Chloroflexota bacterium]
MDDPRNKLNQLSPRQWIKFQKSWFVHNPPPRQKGVLAHPGKFPETLAQEFVEFFTKPGQLVLDPMVGTGSTVVAALRAGRCAIGFDLNPDFAQMARRCAEAECQRLGLSADSWRVEVADARRLADLGVSPVDYCITSPPYWDMLHRAGFETQRDRKERGLPTTYSDHQGDLGNIASYDRFLDELCGIYAAVHSLLKPGGYLTVVVKNVKKGGRMYPLAWDLGRRLGELYELRDERIWLQDNARLAPYGMFNAWVSNTHHHYCLNFRKARAALR